MSDIERQQLIERAKLLQEIKAKQQSLAGPGQQEAVVEEMHPAFSTLDRGIVKNLGDQGNEGAKANVDYLAKNYPDLDVKEQRGRVIARTKGDKGPWRVLDPDTGILSTDSLRDALDVAWPVAQGVAEGAAAAGAGTLAAPSGPGAVAAAMAGGAGAALAGEGARQAFANAVGLQSGVSGEDFAWAAAPNLILPAGGALLGAAKRSVFPTAMGTISGVGKEAIETTMKRLPEMDELESRPLFEGVTDFATAFKDRIQAYLNKPNEQLKSALNASSNNPVRVDDLADPLKKRLAELKDIYRDNPSKAIEGEITRLESFINHHFPFDSASKSSGMMGAAEPHTMRPFSAWELQQRVGDLADYGSYSANKSVNILPEREWTQVKGALDEVYATLGKRLSDATEGVSKQAKDEMADALTLRGQMGRYFSTPESAYSSLTNHGSKSNTMLRGMAERFKKMTGYDLKPTADLYYAQSRLGDKVPGGLSWIPVSGQGVTSTSRNFMLDTMSSPWRLLATGAAGGVGGSQSDFPAGAALGALALPLMTSPRAAKQYIRMMHGYDKLAAKKGFNLGSKAATRSAWHLLDPRDSTGEQ